ncbi:ABC transporter substrate-binding protein [Muricoccus radiodurans]|uniref:ABC transporter substrate-binding protein n=1 Tax=Muricoccus radiodurans TaxID=2231721 RepID=UPI003CE93253
MSVQGRLTVLSAAERPYCEGLIDLFRQAHPGIELDFVFGISTELHRRYLAEVAAGGATCDLIWSSAMDLQMELVLTGHAQPHGVEADWLAASARYRDLALSTTLEPLFTLVRRDAMPGLVQAGTPGEVAELLGGDLASFRGRVACLDIERNGLGFLAFLWAQQQEPGFDRFLEALAACRPRTVGSAPALVESLETGGAVLSLHLLGSYARRASAALPGVLGIAPSAAPPFGVSRIAFIPRGAANPEAARLFLATMMSPEGQTALGAAGLFPIRSARRAADGRGPRLDEGFERLIDPAARERLLRRWRAALGREAPSPSPSETPR